MQLTLNLQKRVLLLFFISIIGFFISSVVSTLLLLKFGSDSTPALRIATVLQDVFVFIVPAVLTAVMVTRQPADLLGLRPRIPGASLCFALFVVVAMAPAINLFIWLNSHIPLPEGIAATVQALEDSADASVRVLMGAYDVPNLIMAILIVSVLAGFSEELLFRGALQRLLVTGGISPHAAIWTTAAVFSLLHLEFFGFIPRLLLGALFGYAFWWTRSIWVPMLMHIVNNAIYVIFQWKAQGDSSPSDIDTLGISGNISDDALAVTLSLILVAAGLYGVYRFRNTHV